MRDCKLTRATAAAILLAGAMLIGGAQAARAAELLIRDATVHTVTSRGTLVDTDVLVRDGVVAAIGRGLAVPPNATVVEAKGRPLTPGLYGGFTDVGLDEVSEEPSTIDSTLNLKSPAWEQQWRPELDVAAAFNPRSSLVPVTRIEGVTWTVLGPSSDDSIMSGQGAAVTLDGRYDAVLPGSHLLFVQMGSDGAKHSGGTRAAEYLLLEQAIREARAKGPVGPDSLLHAAGREALAHYLAGGRVVFAVDRAADILAVIAFAHRNGMKPIIYGGGEAWVVAQQLAQADVPVIVDPLADLPRDFDHLGATLENAARLQKAGVRIAFSGLESGNARLIRQLAGNAVAHGLPADAALAAITANAADIVGIGATRGRIAVGQVADLVLWSGADPLELSSLADQVWIAGHPIPMHSRQTELRDRYLERLRVHEAR